MSVTDELLASAQDYSTGFSHGDLPMPPGRQVAVVACMDARLNVYGLLGLSEGEAHVIRNAGGVISEDAIRSLGKASEIDSNPLVHPIAIARRRQAFGIVLVLDRLGLRRRCIVPMCRLLEGLGPLGRSLGHVA